MNDPWREGNSIELLINGDEFFPSVFEAINNAKQEVLVETFILCEDIVGIQLREALIHAAKRGVVVNFIIDDFGSDNLAPEFIQGMAGAGVNMFLFDPSPSLLGVRFNLFRRLHRKIVVIDGVLAFIGGINYCADQLTNFGPKARQDYAVAVKGPVVTDIRKASYALLYRAQCAIPQIIPPLNKAACSIGSARALLVIRDNHQHKRDIEKHYIKAIHAAKQRVILANAYFFPGIRLLRTLKRAAKRNVSVILILQGNPDLPSVSACSRLLYGYLMRAGVIIYEYQERPLHGKIALTDNQWATVGSSNLDPVSLSLNLEANIMIEDEHFNQTLAVHFESLLADKCKRLHQEDMNKGYWWRAPFIFFAFYIVKLFPRFIGWFPTNPLLIKSLVTRTKKKPKSLPNQTK